MTSTSTFAPASTSTRNMPDRFRNKNSGAHRRFQTGASLVEFAIISLSLVFLGLMTLQISLLFHAKTTLNYATFEAARTGAVNNARLFAMRTELGIRLAPLQGGDGTRDRAVEAIAESTLHVLNSADTLLSILNPTTAAFKDWGVQDSDSGERVIPANHLRHQVQTIGSESGLSLRDANILKIKVVHGVELTVPFAGRLIAGLMEQVDGRNASFYERNLWPLQSVATVRMQSDAYESEVSNGAETVIGAIPGAPTGIASSPNATPHDPATHIPTNPSTDSPAEPSSEPPVEVASSEIAEPGSEPEGVATPGQDPAGAPAPQAPSGETEVATNSELPPCEPGEQALIASTDGVSQRQIDQRSLIGTHEFRQLLAQNH